MLKRLHLRNFTVFEDADFEFGKGLNVIVGANGTGKSHVLKVGYAVELAREEIKAEKGLNKKNQFSTQPEEGLKWDTFLIATLQETFLVEDLRSLVRSEQPKGNAGVDVTFGFSAFDNENVRFQIEPQLGGLGINRHSLNDAEAITPVFIPPKETLSFFSGFGSLNRKYQLSFDLTYTALIDALELPLLRKLSPLIQNILTNAIEPVIQGRLALENGRFYVYLEKTGRTEINLVAEGIRKFGILARLLANGTLTPETTLFWDEPEANLNPKLLKEMAAVLTELAKAGFQIILATHSLFLLKELHILAQREKQPVRYFALYAGENGATQVETKDDFIQLEHIAALDAELTQTFDFEAALDDEYAGDS